MSPSFVALLRGINVGGNRPIKMADLRACFEAMGFADVATYIQSGNVVFSAPRAQELVERIELGLSQTFDYPARVVVRSREQMARVIEQVPAGFGEDRESFRFDVMFLRDSLTVAEAIERIPTRDGVDVMTPGEGVVYLRRLISRASESHLNKLVSMPLYQEMTVRNWNTTTKLSAMLAG